MGAGPGDPGLITRRGAKLLRFADAVVVDRLVDPEALAEVPPGCEIHPVGKMPGGPAWSQGAINDLLVELGGRLDIVVRLKGGDSFVFGRGAEEIAALATAGIEWQVVPGVSSVYAAPSVAGISLTERGVSASVTVVTGHEDPAKSGGEVEWSAIANTGGTLVIVMGVSRWSAIAQALANAGRPGSTPVAAIMDATWPDQSVVHATLDTLDPATLHSPCTLVVGDVADRSLVADPHPAPLVVSTRPEGSGGELADRLEAAGMRPAHVPVIEFEPADAAAVRSAVASLNDGDWVVATSRQGARAVLNALHDVRDLAGIRLAALGEASAAPWRQRGLVVDLVPPEASGAGLVDAFPVAERDGGRALLVTSDLARPVVPDGLRTKGWAVTQCLGYRTTGLDLSDEDAAALRRAAVVIVASPSAWAQVAPHLGHSGPAVVCIGETTAAAVRADRANLAVEVAESTDDLALFRAVRRALNAS